MQVANGETEEVKALNGKGYNGNGTKKKVVGGREITFQDEYQGHKTVGNQRFGPNVRLTFHL